jgi:hypothetical protein
VPANLAEENPLIICEICGAANREFDEQCRVCGQALVAADAVQPAPVVAQSQASSAQPEAPAAPLQAASASAPMQEPQNAPRPVQPSPVIAPQSPLDRLASMGSAPATSAPPMLRKSLEDDVMAMEGDLDPPFSSFNQAGGRLLSSREPLQLISASDLPDWIRQIADADAVKAQEEALKAAEEPEAQSDFQRSLQTDANASGPSTSWLTKSTGPLQ